MTAPPYTDKLRNVLETIAVQIATLRQTCPASPAQWEGRLTDGRPFYIRYRGGYLSVSLGEQGASLESAADAPDWFGKQIGTELDGRIEIDAVCEASGLEMSPSTVHRR